MITNFQLSGSPGFLVPDTVCYRPMRIGTESIPADYIKEKTSFGYVFYKILEGKWNLKSARERCALDSYLLHLPIPRTPEENDFYEKIVQSLDTIVWLGITKTNSTFFIGDDGSKIDWFNWFSGTSHRRTHWKS